jgi:ribosomal protein L37AE/L43A
MVSSQACLLGRLLQLYLLGVVMATYTQRKEPKSLADKQHEEAVRRAMQLDCDDNWPTCRSCGEPFNPRRKALGYSSCLDCGEPKKEFAIVPVPKSNYIVASNPEQLLSPYSHKGTR